MASRDTEADWAFAELAEIDGVVVDREPTRSEPATDPEPPAPPVPRRRTHSARGARPSAVADERGRKRWGEASPFLEDRLQTAWTAAAEIATDLEEIERRAEHLNARFHAVSQELEEARREVAFARGRGLLEAPTRSPIGSVRGRPGRSVCGRPPADQLGAASGYRPSEHGERPDLPARYTEFTIERYNQTVGDLHGRRRRVAAASLLLAAAISAVLVAVAVLSHYPMPPMWMAVLPAVWMVPVPFFVLSFRGTQRVLGEHRFDLRGSP